VVIERAGNQQTWRYVFPVLGTYTVIESEGSNTCATGGTFRVEVLDRTAPETTLTSSPSSVIDSATPTFAFIASEPGSRFECRFDSLPFLPCNSPTVSPPLDDGAHTFAVRATDPAGNTDPTPATVAFRVRRLVAVAATLRASWTHARRTTGVRRLEIRRVPADGRVSVRCRGSGCPFASRRFAPRRAIASLSGSFRTARLRPRTTIEIAVTARNALTKVFQLTVRPFPWDPRVEILCRRSGDVPPTTCETG
jgi:hypothetical protein